MTIRHPLAFAFVLAAAPAAAADFPLSFTADGTSRWYEFYTDSFAQLDKGYGGDPALDGFFRISAEADPFAPTVFQEAAEGADVFPHERQFANIGTITYTGSGNGTFPITAVTLDVSPHVTAEHGVLGTDYRTTVSNPVGTITFAGGVVTDIRLEAAIRFELDANYIPSMGWLPYDGTLSMAGNRFDIFVDDEYIFAHGNLHYAWDLTGSIDGVGGGADLIFSAGFE
jgi:hypothetical protein